MWLGSQGKFVSKWKSVFKEHMVRDVDGVKHMDLFFKCLIIEKVK